MTRETTELAERIGRLAQQKRLRVAVAESLTGGALAQALARAPEASDWFDGGVVAYTSETKFRVLGVDEGPVVTPKCARQLATGVADAMAAHLAVSLTGVGGPDDEEGLPPGTVFMCAVRNTQGADGYEVHDYEHRFAGGATDIVALSVLHALRHLAEIAENA